MCLPPNQFLSMNSSTHQVIVYVGKGGGLLSGWCRVTGWGLLAYKDGFILGWEVLAPACSSSSSPPFYCQYDVVSYMA